MALAEDQGAAPGIGGSCFVLFGPIELGLSATAESQIFGYSRVELAAVGGFRVRLARFEFDLGALAGIGRMHVHQGWVLSDDPGVSGGVEFVGGRAGIAFALTKTREACSRACLALIASFERDLDARTVTYSYTSENWLFGGESQESVTTTLGGSHAALQLAAAFGLD